MAGPPGGRTPGFPSRAAVPFRYMALSEQFKEELAMLKKAPLTFAVGFVVLGCLIGWTEYSLIFKEDLSRKDDVIKTKDSLITTLRDQLSSVQNQKKDLPQPSPQIPLSPKSTQPRRSGDATTSGPNSPATTGNGNAFSYGATDKDKK